MGLNDIISAEARRVLYAVYAFLGIGLGAVQVAYAAADTGQPTWLTIALAVFAFLGTGLGFTAAANTFPGTVEPYESETHYPDGTVIRTSSGVGVLSSSNDEA